MPSTKEPNILITGTPGVGKSSLCAKLSAEAGLNWREVSKIASERNCIMDYDGEYECPFLNEDKLLDSMESMMAEGGNLVDYHGCDFFPERWFDMVIILRTNNTVLYDRLVERGYSGKKLEGNIQCEIFGTIAEEARDSYKEDIVYELNNNSDEDLQRNIETILLNIARWKEEHY